MGKNTYILRNIQIVSWSLRKTEKRTQTLRSGLLLYCAIGNLTVIVQFFRDLSAKPFGSAYRMQWIPLTIAVSIICARRFHVDGVLPEIGRLVGRLFGLVLTSQVRGEYEGG